MAHTKRQYKGPTAAKRCKVPVRIAGVAIPSTCGDRVFKRGQCLEHYSDQRQASEARAIEGNAVNPERRAAKALGLSRRQLVRYRKAQRIAEKAAMQKDADDPVISAAA